MQYRYEHDYLNFHKLPQQWADVHTDFKRYASRFMRRAGYNSVVCCYGGNVVGVFRYYLGRLTGQDRMSIRGCGLYVLRLHRRRGIGMQLLAQAIQKHNPRTMHLSPAETANVRSLYRRLEEAYPRVTFIYTEDQ